MIDATHWEKLHSLDPSEVAGRSLAEYDERAGAYRLSILADELLIRPAGRSVSWADVERRGDKPPGFHYWLVSVVYLISARPEPCAGEWVGPSSLPYGEFFFRGPHELPTGAIADTYGADAERFADAARRLGGRPWPQGCNAFELPALPKIPILVQLWERDEEFPARASFLFDRATCSHLPIDAVLSLSVIVANRLVEAGDRELRAEN